MTNDPIRLIDDPSVVSSLRADLAEAASAGLEGFDLAAGVAGLNAAIAADVTGATAVTTGAAKASGGWVGKAIVAAVLVGGGAAAWFATRPDPEASATPAHIAATSVDNAEPHRAAPVESVAQPAAPAPDVHSTPRVPAAVPVEPTSPAPAAVEPTAPKARPAVKAAHKPAAKPKANDFVREARLIADARQALKTDPQRALALLKDARRSFPRGMLAEEREALTVVALSALGKSDEAARRGDRFLKKHGKGPYAEAVRQALD